VSSDRSSDDLATRAARALWAGDAASRALGMRLLEVRTGYGRVAMTIRPDMVNGHDTVHGGITFALADSAFAVACNSHNRATVAQTCDVTFLAPGRLGDELVAEARERGRWGRNGITDVTVTRLSDGAVLAEFRGRSREVPGRLVEDD
jgi:3-hydroxybutyryl-CoA dehydrogenase